MSETITLSTEQKLEEKNKKLKGTILWMVILFGYFIFVFNWMVMNSLAGTIGDNGWKNTYFEIGAGPSTLVTNAVNWSITFMRGVGALLAGWMLVKVGHRYSVIIAFGFLSIATVTSWLPFYSLFILGRMLMAVGGTVLIVYTQPVIANYFTSSKSKSNMNLVNSFGFNAGAILAFLPFMFSGIGDAMIDNWQMWSTIFASAAVVLLIIYIFVSRGEDPVPRKIKGEKQSSTEVSFMDVMKEKRTWIFGITFAFWLTAVVTMITLVSPLFGTMFTTEYAWASKLWSIAFLAGLIPGIFCVGFWGKTTNSRKPFIIGIVILGVITATISILLAEYSNTGETASMFMFVTSMILIFISGTCLWGIQGVLLGMTYEYEGATPQKQGILLGAIWGIGYMGNTFLTIILSIVRDESQGWFFVLFIMMSLATAAMFTLAPETHKNGKLIHKNA